MPTHIKLIFGWLTDGLAVVISVGVLIRVVSMLTQDCIDLWRKEP
jgi:hypothetical protein